MTNDGMKIELQESGSEFDAILHHLWQALRIRPSRHKDVQQKIARFFITIFFYLNIHGSLPIKNVKLSHCVDPAAQPDQKEIRRIPGRKPIKGAVSSLARYFAGIGMALLS